MYAADGALQIAARELLRVADWNALLSSGALSAFVDGPATAASGSLGDGTTVDLAQATSAAEWRAAPVGREQSRMAIVCVRVARSEDIRHRVGRRTTPPRTTAIP